MPIVIDDRLLPLLEIEEPNRQQIRRVERTATPCSKCFRPCTPDDVCFADGKDTHRSCAETWNAEMLDGWEQLKAQDAAAAEDTRRQNEQANRRSALWIPPSATPAVTATRA